MRDNLTVGLNVDKVDIAKGLSELKACGYNNENTSFVIEYALMRWARGEEVEAQKGAIDQTFWGVDLTSWTRILASAIAH